MATRGLRRVPLPPPSRPPPRASRGVFPPRPLGPPPRATRGVPTPSPRPPPRSIQGVPPPLLPARRQAHDVGYSPIPPAARRRVQPLPPPPGPPLPFCKTVQIQKLSKPFQNFLKLSASKISSKVLNSNNSKSNHLQSLPTLLK